MKIMSAWECAKCDVTGRDPGEAPECWNCGGEVVVTARLGEGSLHWVWGAR